jgi:hypothetical protein
MTSGQVPEKSRPELKTDEIALSREVTENAAEATFDGRGPGR